MSLKIRLKVILALMIINAFILVAASEAIGQERIDNWYGQEMTDLHAQLKSDGDKFKYKDYGNDKVSLTMTDYRGIKCEYISLNGGYTVKYRVDHYSKKEYASRVSSIQRKWQKSGSVYILRNTVVAMLDDKNHRIGFALKRDYEEHSGASFNRESL